MKRARRWIGEDDGLLMVDSLRRPGLNVKTASDRAVACCSVVSSQASYSSTPETVNGLCVADILISLLPPRK